MKESIEKKMKEAEGRFEKLKLELQKVEESQQKVNDARTQLNSEAMRLQGEYRGFQALLAEIGAPAPTGEVTGDKAAGTPGNEKPNGGSGQEGGRILEAASRIGK